MRPLSIIILLCLLSVAKAQDGKYFYVGAQITPGVSHRVLFLNSKVPQPNIANIPDFIFNLRNKSEHPYIYGATGIVCGFQVKNFFAVESGVNYAHHSYRHIDNNLFFDTGGYNDTSYNNNLQPCRLILTYGYHYLNIPLGIRFSLGKSAFKATIGTGAEINVLLKKYTHTHLTNPDGSIYRNYNNNVNLNPHQRANLTAYLSVGVSYSFKNNVTISFAPIARIQCLYNTKQTPVTERLWSVGMQTGVTYRLPLTQKKAATPDS
ncbi:MAG: outer membrane beta-barrel protein [Chitinophagales bacterium]|nr:outer membrane beta-barrel protein [Chitinophagales bacterium]